MRKSAFGPTYLSSDILEMREEKLEIKDFRNIHLVERRKHAVKSHSEATGLLNLDSSDPSALHYLGWWHLCNPSGRIEDAVEYLKRSIESGKLKYHESQLTYNEITRNRSGLHGKLLPTCARVHGF